MGLVGVFGGVLVFGGVVGGINYRGVYECISQPSQKIQQKFDKGFEKTYTSNRGSEKFL